MSAQRHRTIRLDLATPIYDELQALGLERDVGTSDLIRHVLVEWLKTQRSSRSASA